MWGILAGVQSSGQYGTTTTLGDVRMITLTELVELNRHLDEWVYGPEGPKRFSGKNDTMKKVISEMVKFREVKRTQV